MYWYGWRAEHSGDSWTAPALVAQWRDSIAMTRLLIAGGKPAPCRANNIFSVGLLTQ